MKSRGRSHTPDKVTVPRSSAANSSRSAFCFLVKYFCHISIPEATYSELISDLCKKMGGIAELQSRPSLDGKPQCEMVLCP
jgi:hypothetical protein